MKRLTTDTPDGNFETMLNFVYGKDGLAHIRHDGENADVILTEWARKQCLNRGCDVFPEESIEKIDAEICDCMMDFPDCPVALAYCFASQAVHLRSRLKKYEDILFAEDGTELVSMEQLRTMVSRMPNPPLTLDELREMDGETVYTAPVDGGPYTWMLVDTEYEVLRGAHGEIAVFENWSKTWIAYRRKPEEGETL